jgi:chromosome segregation ATPase
MTPGPIPDGAPWWVWLVALVVMQAGTLLGLVVTQRRNSRKLDRAVEQVENDHADHPYPNLRQQLDAIQDTAAKAVSTAARAAEATERLEAGHRETRADIGGLRGDVRQVRDDVGDVRREATTANRRVRDLDDRLTQHIAGGD